MKEKIKKYWDVLFLFLSVFSLLLGFRCKSLIYFLIAGVSQGVFYGKNNYRIFHYPHTDKFYEKYSEFKKKTNFAIPPINPKAEINSYWVHIVSATVGAVALFFLSFRFDPLHPYGTIRHLNTFDVVVLLIAILGYAGLLPRLLWFFASSGGLGDFIKPKDK
jgi:hypothetical protein